MKKFLIFIITIFMFTGLARADAKISGFMQHIIGMGDDVDGGVTDKFSRFAFSADATLNNGWTAGGSFVLSVQPLLSATADAYLPTSNSFYIQTDTATLTIGQTGDAVTNLIPRVSAMVPGDGTDGYYFALFDSGTLATSDTGFAEVYYAQNSSRVNVALPIINGISVQVTYTPSLEFNASTSNARQSATESSNHGETVHIAASYEGEIDGISYIVGLGSISGNAKSTAGTYAANDLNVFTGGIKATMANLTLGAHGYDHGESFGRVNDANKASDSGYTFAAEYALGNITVGIGYAHQEKVDGGTSDKVKEDTIIYYGIGYDLGGGVNTWVQLDDINHSDGDHATTEVDPQIIMAGISLGF